MATAALVDRDIELGRQIVVSLTQAKIPVTVYLWAFVSDEWLFIVATPLVDSKGPLAAYDEVNRALQRAGVADQISRQRIFLMSPNDRELKLLEKQSKVAPYEAVRTVNASIAGRFVEDAYLYGGSVFIAKVGSAQPTPREYYSAIYTPFSGPRHPAPARRFDTLEEVRQFLERELRLDRQTADVQIQKLRTMQSALIPVSLNPAQLRTLELG